MSKSVLVICFAFISTIAFFSLNHVAQQPPEPKPATAPANEFSAERAHNLLQTLLAENKPHPVGSPQNRVVKSRITAELDRLSIGWEEQATWACAHRYNGCAFVENIIAIIPGKSGDSFIALMAHYDSVPMAPGAGDDGAGVVAILESARALALEAPFEHSIMLLFTDAEEMGLIGAEGFFNQHPLAKKIKVVLDFEGSGTTGQSMVLRTTDGNELLMNTLASETSSPFGFSFANEIFKRMPNDTDFSVVQRAGISGIDFAFAGERNHYHTPNDNTENLDLATIQHHGENMLPLTRELANNKSLNLGEHVVYANFYGQWMQWVSDHSIYLVLASALALLIALRRMKPAMKEVLIGILTSIGILFGTIAVGLGAFQLVALVLGTTVSWPANDFPHRTTLIFSTLAGGLTMIAFANKFSNQAAMMFAGWLLLLIVCVASLIYLPDAANTFLAPTLVASMLLLVMSFLPEPWRPWLFVLALIGVLPSTLGVIYLLEQSQGYTLIVATMPFIGLYMIAFAPFTAGVKLRNFALLAYLGSFASIAMIALTPLYSQERPQHVNIHYYEDMNNQVAYNRLASSNPIIEPLASVKRLHLEEKKLLPFGNAQQKNWTDSSLSGWSAPGLAVREDQVTDGARAVAVTLTSVRGADAIGLVIPIEAKLRQFHLGSQTYSARPINSGVLTGHNFIKLIGVYHQPVTLTLEFDTITPIDDVYLIDFSTELPADSQSLFQHRAVNMSPVHGGDQAQLFSKIRL